MTTFDLTSYGVAEMSSFEMVNTDGETCIPVPTCINVGSTVGVAVGVAVGVSTNLVTTVGGIKHTVINKVGNLIGNCGC